MRDERIASFLLKACYRYTHCTKIEETPTIDIMAVSFSRFRGFRLLVAMPSLLLLLILCLSSSNRYIGAVNGLSLSWPSQICTRNIGINSYQSNTASRLWMTTKTSSNTVSSDDDDDDNNNEGDDNLPKLKKKLTREFFSIGFPAFIQLAAEPLAALVVRRSPISFLD